VHSQLLVSVAPLKAASATHLVDVSFSYVWHFHVLTCPFDAIVGGLHQYHLQLAELGLDFRFHQQLLLPYSLFDVVVRHQFPPPPLHPPPLSFFGLFLAFNLSVLGEVSSPRQTEQRHLRECGFSLPDAVSVLSGP